MGHHRGIMTQIISGIFVSVHDDVRTFVGTGCIVLLSHHLPVEIQIPFDPYRYCRFIQANSLSCFGHSSFFSWILTF